VHIWKFLMGFCAFLEVPRGILCILGKFFNGFCAYLEVRRGILCIFRSSS
jgi:hypothetical protein